jgi:hypothetical protein
MIRRVFLLLVYAACSLSLTLADWTASSSAEPSPRRITIPVGDLKEQLQSKLRPRSPQEFAFIDRVVSMVQRQQLPMNVVKVTFNWARKKPTEYRFPYFQRALRIQAAKLGIQVI